MEQSRLRAPDGCLLGWACRCGISFSHADLQGATGDVAVPWAYVVAWVVNELRRANWETLAQLGGETKACLRWGARMFTCCQES